jgi:sigma54-dependent transcription regulator
MMTNDKLTCEDSLSYFEHQIKNSRSLNESGNRERKVFFNKMYEQIERLKQNLS